MQERSSRLKITPFTLVSFVMCLILFAHQVHSRYGLVLAANRDEFLSREALPMNWWSGDQEILAGVDLQAGGSWLGINRQGYWAAVTNFRGSQANPDVAPSRGDLVAKFLSSKQTALEYLNEVETNAGEYRGFNLLVSDKTGLYYFGNRNPNGGALKSLPPGVYGLSNHLLNTDWPKVDLGKSKLSKLIETSTKLEHESLFNLLTDHSRPVEDRLPDTGISLEKEKLLSSMFISSADYGTRCSTSLLIDSAGTIDVAEKSHPHGEVIEFQFKR